MTEAAVNLRRVPQMTPFTGKGVSQEHFSSFSYFSHIVHRSETNFYYRLAHIYKI